jgi:hypothetical protein
MAEGHHRVDLDLTGDGAPRAATSTFDFHLSSQDEEDLRWYLEDFLQYPQEPAPTIALRIEGQSRGAAISEQESTPFTR